MAWAQNHGAEPVKGWKMTWKSSKVYSILLSEHVFVGFCCMNLFPWSNSNKHSFMLCYRRVPPFSGLKNIRKRDLYIHIYISILSIYRVLGFSIGRGELFTVDLEMETPWGLLKHRNCFGIKFNILYSYPSDKFLKWSWFCRASIWLNYSNSLTWKTDDSSHSSSFQWRHC